MSTRDTERAPRWPEYLAPRPKHAAFGAVLAVASAGFGLAGLWPVSCILSTGVGIQWVLAWEPNPNTPNTPANSDKHGKTLSKEGA